MTGALLPALIPGGQGGLLGAVAAAGAIPRGAAALGRVGAGLTGRAFGAGAVGRIASLGVAGAIEGAAYGVGQQVTEDVLGDHELTASKLASAGALAAGLGFGGGVVLGAGAEALSAASQRYARRAGALRSEMQTAADDALGVPNVEKEAAQEVEDMLTVEGRDRAARAKFDAAMKGKAERAANSMSERFLSRIVDPEKREAARTVIEQSRAAVNGAEDAIQSATRRTAKAGDDLFSTMQGVREKFYGESKATKFAEMITPDDAARTYGAMVAQRDAIRGKLESLAEMLGPGESNVTIRKALGHLDTLDHRMVGTTLLGARTVDEVRAGYIAFDRFKQELGREAGYGLESLTRSQRDIRDVYEGVRTMLEDASLWGERAASAQRSMNAATSQMLETSEGARAALLRTQKEVVGGDLVLRADSGKVKNFLDGAGLAESASAQSDVARFLDGHEAQIKAAREFWNPTPAEEAVLAKGEAAIKTFRKELAAASETTRKARDAKRAIEAERDGAIGGTLGLVADAFLRPVTTAQRLADLARMARGVDRAIESGAAKFVRGGAKGGAPGAAVDAKDLLQKVQAARADQAAAADRVAEALGGAADAAPRTGLAVGQVMARAIDYLYRTAPVPRRSVDPLPRPGDERYAPRDLDAYARRGEGALYPHRVVDRLASGRLAREHVEALREVHPPLYQQIKTQILGEVAKHRDRLTFQQAQMLSVLLDTPMSEFQRPEFVAAMQAAYGAPAEPQGPSPAPPRGPQLRRSLDIAGASQTQTQRLEGRGGP